MEEHGESLYKKDNEKKSSLPQNQQVLKDLNEGEQKSKSIRSLADQKSSLKEAKSKPDSRNSNPESRSVRKKVFNQPSGSLNSQKQQEEERSKQVESHKDADSQKKKSSKTVYVDSQTQNPER